MKRINIGKALPPMTFQGIDPERPDWVQANPKAIERALERALSKPTGGWHVLDGSRQVTDAPKAYAIDGRALVAWRTGSEVWVAPDRCPHMGAELSCGRMNAGRLVCPWHGLELGPEGRGSWKPMRAYDDGVLLWVQLPGSQVLGSTETPSAQPVLAQRPPLARCVEGTVRMEARCEPEDVMANRLDPWHGVHYHPHSFAHLVVTAQDEDSITLRVAYRVAGPFCVEVDARFHCPDARTIVMTIVGGDGVGSVVETHATPIAPGRTAVVETTLATSDRPGFRWLLRAASWLRPQVERRAARLWVEDIAYAERRYQLRRAQQPQLGSQSPVRDLATI